MNPMFGELEEEGLKLIPVTPVVSHPVLGCYSGTQLSVSCSANRTIESL